MEEDTEPQEIMDVVEDFAEAEAEIQQEEVREESQTQVPLSALQKERKKRQELEQELQWERSRAQRAPEPPPEEDNSRYESATKEDLYRSQNEAMRLFEEKHWIKNNPEKYEKINELLPGFLKLRPNYATAINDAPNRYEEAYSLMEAFNPKQPQRTAPPVRKVAPNAPGGVPKAAALNEAVDLMNMSDTEYQSWRKSQKGRR